MKRTVLRAVLFCFVVMFITLHLGAADDETELAKKTQNPVADLISGPCRSVWAPGRSSR